MKQYEVDLGFSAENGDWIILETVSTTDIELAEMIYQYLYKNVAQKKANIHRNYVWLRFSYCDEFGDLHLIVENEFVEA